MKKTLWLLLAILLVGSCDDGDAYFVKYIVNGNNPNLSGMMHVTFMTEDGTPSSITIEQHAFWRTTIGPVHKGFEAVLNVVNVDKNPDWYVTGAISTKYENGTTYHYTATNSGGDQILSLSYTIE